RAVLRTLPVPHARRRLGGDRPPHARPGSARGAVRRADPAPGLRRPPGQLRGDLRMTTPKSPQTPARQPASPAAPETGLVGAWVNFWFAAVDPVGLHALRALAGLLFLFWLLPFAGDHQALFGLGGWFDATAYREASRLGDLPPHMFGWSVLYWC